MWPAINKGLNVVGIGSSQCGKTSGCVMAVCGLVAMYQNVIIFFVSENLIFFIFIFYFLFLINY